MTYRTPRKLALLLSAAISIGCCLGLARYAHMGDVLAVSFVALFLGGGCLCWVGIIGYHLFKIIKGEP
jgi:hypothetical protein